MEKNETTTLTPLNDEGTCFMLQDSGHSTFCSYPAKTIEAKKNLYNMINSPQQKLGDHVNLTINLSHVFAETCTYINQETGEATPGVRIVLIDSEGVSYSTSSSGVYNSLTKIFNLFGTPDHWKEPLPIRVKQVNKDTTRRVYVLELV